MDTARPCGSGAARISRKRSGLIRLEKLVNALYIVPACLNRAVQSSLGRQVKTWHSAHCGKPLVSYTCAPGVVTKDLVRASKRPRKLRAWPLRSPSVRTQVQSTAAAASRVAAFKPALGFISRSTRIQIERFHRHHAHLKPPAAGADPPLMMTLCRAQHSDACTDTRSPSGAARAAYVSGHCMCCEFKVKISRCTRVCLLTAPKPCLLQIQLQVQGAVCPLAVRCASACGTGTHAAAYCGRAGADATADTSAFSSSIEQRTGMDLRTQLHMRHSLQRPQDAKRAQRRLSLAAARVLGTVRCCALHHCLIHTMSLSCSFRLWHAAVLLTTTSHSFAAWPPLCCPGFVQRIPCTHNHLNFSNRESLYA